MSGIRGWLLGCGALNVKRIFSGAGGLLKLNLDAGVWSGLPVGCCAHSERCWLAGLGTGCVAPSEHGWLLALKQSAEAWLPLGCCWVSVLLRGSR